MQPGSPAVLTVVSFCSCRLTRPGGSPLRQEFPPRTRLRIPDSFAPRYLVRNFCLLFSVFCFLTRVFFAPPSSAEPFFELITDRPSLNDFSPDTLYSLAPIWFSKSFPFPMVTPPLWGPSPRDLRLKSVRRYTTRPHHLPPFEPTRIVRTLEVLCHFLTSAQMGYSFQSWDYSTAPPPTPVLFNHVICKRSLSSPLPFVLSTPPHEPSRPLAEPFLSPIFLPLPQPSYLTASRTS